MSDNEDKAWADYSERFRQDGLPKIMSAGMFVSIHSDRTNFDVRQATELGAAMLLGKPMLLVVPRGTTLPDGLRRAAIEVVDDWHPGDVDAQERVTAALERMTNALSNE